MFSFNNFIERFEARKKIKTLLKIPFLDINNTADLFIIYVEPCVEQESDNINPENKGRRLIRVPVIIK